MAEISPIVRNAQKMLYKTNKFLAPLRDKVAEQKEELARSIKELKKGEDELRQWADFLAENHPVQDWHANVGLVRRHVGDDDLPPKFHSKKVIDWPLNGELCSVCGEAQYRTPSGPCCENGHGGAPPKD